MKVSGSDIYPILICQPWNRTDGQLGRCYFWGVSAG